MAIRMRFVAALVLLLLVTPCCFAANPKPAPPISGGGVTGLDLETQLQKGLFARRDVEFEYIHEIVQLVEEGTLPRKIVVSTFMWAKAKPTRQLQYFQFAIQARTRGMNIPLPNLNLQAVGISNNGGEHGVNTPAVPQR